MDPTRDLEQPGLMPEGSLAPFTCPDCSGNIWKHKEGNANQYVCRVGHSYSPENMRVAADEALERVLWSAIRSLEEHAALYRDFAVQARGREEQELAGQFENAAAERDEMAKGLRRIVVRR